MKDNFDSETFLFDKLESLQHCISLVAGVSLASLGANPQDCRMEPSERIDFTDDDITAQLRSQTTEHLAELTAYVNAYYPLSEKLRGRYFETPLNSTVSNFVFTHGDALGLNLIRRNSGFSASSGDSGSASYVIVDWDSILLAPCERDLWFYLSPETDKCALAKQLERSHLR